jgi:hypothetical protein
MASVTFGATKLNPAARENADLLAQLEKLKIQQAMAAAQSGQAAGGSPAQIQAAQLAAQMQRQQSAQGSSQGLQTERIQSSERMTGAQLAAQMQQLQQRQTGDRAIQGDRLQSTERMTGAQLAAQMQRQLAAQGSNQGMQTQRLNQGAADLATKIKGQRDVQADASKLEEDRKKDSAARALALFRSAPGASTGKLNMAGARAELG